MSVSPIHKQLKIKSGVVQRLTKDHDLYGKEVKELEARKEKLLADGAVLTEDWDWGISNATKLIQESETMIQDTVTRLKKAAKDLAVLITSAKTDLADDDKELINAEEILKAAQDIGVDLEA